MLMGAHRARWSTALLLALAGLATACSDVDGAKTAEFSVRPEAFVFPRLSIGQQTVRRVTVSNEGTGDLILIEIGLDDRSSANEFELALEDGGVEAPVGANDRIVLAPGAERVFAVHYNPADEIPDGGAVVMSTNDPNLPRVSIEIRASETAGEIDVNPRTVDFGGVEVGQTATEPLTVTNLGVAELVISRLEVSGRAGFGVQYAGEDVQGALAEPIVVGPGAQIVLDARYVPAAPGVADGELLIESNAVNTPELTVRLYANGAEPCINVTPGSIDFGSGLLVDDRAGETPNQRGVTIESCGTVPLRVRRIEFEDPRDAFGVLDLPEAVEGEPLIELPAAVAGEEFPARLLQVGFWPVELGVYGGRMLVYSDATPVDEPVAVDLFGRGVDNTCPLPVSTRDAYEVQPLDIITLDGTPSTDPDGEVVEWRWTVVQRPDGSVSQPVESFDDPTRPADGGADDDTGTPRALFFIDLAGDYVIELQAVDALGQPSCDPPAAQIRVSAVPEQDLHIQLVWTTPDDPDETDTIGTDIDLHFRHERAGEKWGSEAQGWDCYFRNTNPDWGVLGEVVDNPSLDIDDTNGAGPENINLSEPEIGVTYDIGAIYFRASSTFGDPMIPSSREHPSYATLRVFTRGVPLLELVGQELDETSQLWHVARVTWCEGPDCPRVDVVNEVLDVTEYNLP
ncbi:MAG: choice-of-anchor D domain-containing protein [Myxococcales bacterium]|nr:choice-of-anchor D domain-containing protein [Myxococcales bacterium]